MIHLIVSTEKPRHLETVETACGESYIFEALSDPVPANGSNMCPVCERRAEHMQEGDAEVRVFFGDPGMRQAEPLPVEEGALDDAIHALFSKRASDLNNRGTAAQVAYLREQGWSDRDILAETQWEG